MRLKIIESVLNETLDGIKKYYPNIPEDIFMKLIALDPTYTGKDSAGKYGKWLLNLYNRGKLSDEQFDEVTSLLNQFTTYRNRIQNKDLNTYKTIDELAEVLASVVDDMSMLTPSQKTKFLKRVKSGKIKVDKSEDYDIVLDTPNFVVYVPNTHEASMKLGKDTEWCTAHENPEWYEKYTKNGHKLYIVKDKKTGERWQYSDDTGDFLDEDDEEFDISELISQDEKLSKFFEKFLGADYYNFDGTFIYTGRRIPHDLAERVENVVVSDGVTSIDKLAFYECSSLESITIPNSVTHIGYSAFNGCTSLTSITIPKSVTSIDDSAFYDCSSLTSITIPNSITIIGKGAFGDCYSLKSITIPDSVTSIGAGAFRHCSSLESITISNSITSIGTDAFSDCSSLTSITIPDSVTMIGERAFIDCSNLKRITIPNNITSIGYSAFAGCSSLKSITIPNSITCIDDWTFSGCSSLTRIIIPNSVKSIARCAFDECSSLTSITIPNSITRIGDYVFRDCPNLTVYTDNDYATDYCKENNVSVAPLSERPKKESYRKQNKLKLLIRE